MNPYPYTLKEKIRYRFKTRHYKGFGIHSPFLYRFISFVLEEKKPYYCFNQIENLRQELYFRNGPQRNRSKSRRWHKKDALCGQTIFRIIQDAQFSTLLEIGITEGMLTHYMALGNPKARCISLTRSAELAAKAAEQFTEQEISQVELKVLKPGESPLTYINSIGHLDFVLFNRLADSQECLNIFMECLHKKNNGSIFVLLGIHDDPDKVRAWAQIKSLRPVKVTIDLYDLGVVLFNSELEKRNYVIRK
jgi:hypothetical protein